LWQCMPSDGKCAATFSMEWAGIRVRCYTTFPCRGVDEKSTMTMDTFRNTLDDQNKNKNNPPDSGNGQSQKVGVTFQASFEAIPSNSGRVLGWTCDVRSS
jgi:hypothetical protein